MAHDVERSLASVASVCRSVAWSSLLSHLHRITDTVVFQRKLKTELFRQAFDQWQLTFY